MPVSLTHLRRWFALAAVLVVLVVAGVYFYARHRVQNALQQVPEKIGLEIKQTATGFSVSKSDQGRTLFKLEASKAVQFKAGGHAELHDVTITLFGRDSARYDRIYGSDFTYDQASGEAIAHGDVQIDLEANPEGILSPDQAPPKELKTPIHLKTKGLVFQEKNGDAYTNEKVEFSMPQASGSAIGVRYLAKSNVLILESAINLITQGPASATVIAQRAMVSHDPRQVLLEHPHFEMPGRNCDADQATLFLRPDDTLGSVLASGNVAIHISGRQNAEVHAEKLEVTMTAANTPHTAILSGAVSAEMSGDELIHANAGRVVLDFASESRLTKVRAEDGVKLAQVQKPSSPASIPQKVEITSAVINFFLGKNGRLDDADTPGAAQIAFAPVSGDGPQTFVTGGQFQVRFDSLGRPSSLHGSPDARIVSRNSGQPDRVSTSENLDVQFQDSGRISSILQTGNVAYQDGDRRAWSQRARYTPSDQILVLNGSPRVTDAGMTTTATSMLMNRATGDALAEGNVKTTYSDLKAQPNGALLASSSPIHVTAERMTIHGNAAVSLYGGGARLWQDANIVDAPSIEFDRNNRAMLARGTADKPVSTVLVQKEKNEKPVSVAITSSLLTYTDSERRAYFEQNVLAKEDDLAVTADQMEAFLAPRGPDAISPSDASKLDKIIASNHVKVTQPDREATGDTLTYTSADDKFVLTGGPPSIFDAEHGKITGVSLTFYRTDDRVLVEGNNSFPTVTQTRVAR